MQVFRAWAGRYVGQQPCILGANTGCRCDTVGYPGGLATWSSGNLEPVVAVPAGLALFGIELVLLGDAHHQRDEQHRGHEEADHEAPQGEQQPVADADLVELQLSWYEPAEEYGGE